MGMAASQARYLSLAARKTNVEYEGQQINHQRINLANQTADLFNQMLTCSVPTCPDSNDFTRLQYSYSDGLYEFALDEWYQLSVPSEEYNYVVTSYRYGDVYTAQHKKMNDPQIQASKVNRFEDYNSKTYDVDSIWYNQNNDTYIVKTTSSGQESEKVYELSKQTEDEDVVDLIDYLYKRTEDVNTRNLTYDETTDLFTLTYSSSNVLGTYGDTIPPLSTITYSKVDTENHDLLMSLIKSYGARYDSSKTYYVSETGNSYLTKDDYDYAMTHQPCGVQIRKNDDNMYYTDGTYYISTSELDEVSAGGSMTVYTATNNPIFYNYTAVGNLELTAVTADQLKNNPDMEVEINKILKDLTGYGIGGVGVATAKSNYSHKIIDPSDIDNNDNPDPVDPVDPVDPTDSNITLNRGDSAVLRTISPDTPITLSLVNPYDNKEYTYNISSLNNEQEAEFQMLNNGRLLVRGNYLNIEAADGQKDDIILLGSNNNISTGDGDDIVRLGYVRDSAGYTQQSDANTISAGTGDDHVSYYGVNNNIDMGAGNDTVGTPITKAALEELIANGLTNVSNAEIHRSYSANDGIASNNNEGWANQANSNDCRLFSVLNSIVHNNNSGSLSSVVDIDSYSYYKFTNGNNEDEIAPVYRTGDGVPYYTDDLNTVHYITDDDVKQGWDVTFKNYCTGNNYGYQKGIYTFPDETDLLNNWFVEEDDIANYQGVFGDIDVVVADYALNSLMNHNRDTVTIGAETISNESFAQAPYNVVANYLYGTDEFLYKQYTSSGELDSLYTLWDLYQNNTISNLTVGLYGAENNSEGVITSHAYSVKDLTDSYVSLINPWNDEDVLNLDINTFLGYSPVSFVYGWADLDNTYGLNPGKSISYLFNETANNSQSLNNEYSLSLDTSESLVADNVEELQRNVEILQGALNEMTERGGSNIPLEIDDNNYVANLMQCFTSTGEYKEGTIYSFKMYGKTYYTTANDLNASLISAYREDATASNGIDSQHDKLNFYCASYIPQRIEETKKALLETDGKGRFTSVRFEGDDTKYVLNVETVTDDDAYQNAMNQYYFKQEKYDKQIADINAKTELIQAEDRQLLLKLKQLDTEQTALQTEMEACQKVVSKNVESGFKAFGG